ncbi:MAG: hypothetical protein R3E53_17785 [Myxococcota bacterium]
MAVTRGIALVRMPMRVRQQAVVHVEVQVPPLAPQIDHDVEPERRHHEADAPLGPDPDARRQRLPQHQQHEARDQQHEAMTHGPAETRPDAAPRVLAPRRQHGHRHHVIRVEGVHEAQSEREPQPADRRIDRAPEPRRELHSGRPPTVLSRTEAPTIAD